MKYDKQSFDDIEDIAPGPLKPVKKKDTSLLTDRLLGATGVALAAFATFFPWYAFFHQDKFSVPSLWQGTTRDLPEAEPRNVMNVSPLAMTDGDKSGVEPGLADPLTTATVPSLGEEKNTGKSPAASLEQPFPVSTGFRLMHVANGRALIEDASGMYIVRIGSILPDNSRLATIEKRKDEWVIVTSNGDVFKRN
ncbi:flagellar protein [Pararhizobium sp.]|uniref:flagellar protein n=1 Tax=Pararhizobium sp. TaxID=1977563 RepID=UPI00271C76AB|nr:flagellar protein [Pararhizobium sp.]MDO9416067.1 flagellar protein [Pararhizobium sp.]